MTLHASLGNDVACVCDPFCARLKSFRRQTTCLSLAAIRHSFSTIQRIHFTLTLVRFSTSKSIFISLSLSLSKAYVVGVVLKRHHHRGAKRATLSTHAQGVASISLRLGLYRSSLFHFPLSLVVHPAPDLTIHPSGADRQRVAIGVWPLANADVSEEARRLHARRALARQQHRARLRALDRRKALDLSEAQRSARSRRYRSFRLLLRIKNPRTRFNRTFFGLTGDWYAYLRRWLGPQYRVPASDYAAATFG